MRWTDSVEKIMTMRILIKSLLGPVILTIVLAACKSYYNDTIEWMDNIELGATLDDVKRNQPDFVKIDWGKPGHG